MVEQPVVDYRKRSRSLHLALVLRQNSTIVFLLLAWFVLNFVVLLGLGHPLGDALKILTFFKEDGSAWGTWYRTMSDFVVFGLVVGVVMVDVQRRYRPEVTCRVLAGELENHAVVVCFSHLGQRVVEFLEQHHIPTVVIEPDRAVVEDLIRQERPLVLGNGRQRSDLEAANLKAARLVVLSADDLETNSVVASLVRQMNPDCSLIVRVFEDDIGEVLAKRYNATVISTSRLAAEFIKDYASKHNSRYCVIVGGGQMGRRLVKIMTGLNVEYRLIEESRAAVEDLMDNHPVMIGHPADKDLLAQANVPRADLVVLTDDNLSRSLPVIDHIRDLNTSCRIVCRVFHDDAADMITREPFHCDVISTSRYAVDSLARKGAFQKIGLGAGAATASHAVRASQGKE